MLLKVTVGGKGPCVLTLVIRRLSSTHSDAVWQREVVLLQVSDQRPAVDLAPDPLLHHLPPVELQARVHRVHALGGQVRARG